MVAGEVPAARDKDEVMTAGCMDRRSFDWVLLLRFLVFSFAVSSAQAFDPPQPIAALVHTSWSLKEEAPTAVWQIAQTSQGDLWLATGAGVYRFDGLRFVQFRTVGGTSLVTEMIDDLFVTPPGDIWIGYHGGGISLVHDGRITSYTTGIPPGPIKRIAQGRDGAIWVATFGGVAVFRAGVWQTIPWAYEFGRAYNLLVARDGMLWIAAEHALLFIRPGSEKVEKTSEAVEGTWAFAQAPDGRLWVSDDKWGLRALDPAQVLRSSDPSRPAPPRKDALRARVILFDHDGRLWGSYQSGPGIFRVLHPERFVSGKPLRLTEADESFGTKDGLTSDTASPLFEDREGNIWIGTELGLDRFRRADVNVSNTISKDSREGYRAVVGSTGEFYVADDDTLYRADTAADFKKIGRDPWHPDELCAGRNGEIWVSDQHGLRRIANNEMLTVTLPAAARKGEAFTCTEDASGTLWISILGVGVFTYEGIWRGPLPIPLPQNVFPRLLVAERGGGIWAYDRGLNLFLIKDGGVRSFSAAQGLQVGEIKTLVSNPSGTFVGGELGLARLNGDRFESVTTDRYPDLSLITGIAQDAEGDTWLSSIHGVIKLRTSELLEALARPGRPLNMRHFDFRDGVPGMAQQSCCHATAFSGKSDRVWFITSRGVAWVDPARLTFNALPPPVLIRSVTVNGQVLAPANQMRFPPSVSNLNFDFAALSLSIPERVRFRYRLEGWDNDWQDGGNRRQAFYTNLSPRNYRFRVIASNDSGVWNETGASFDFSVAPAWYQTDWFRLCCVAALLGLLWALYRFRLHQVAREYDVRLEERVDERNRIAGELHDTLLQSFQGLMMLIHTALDLMPARTAEARTILEKAVDRGGQAITEGRNAIHDIRAPVMVTNDLAEAVSALSDELASGNSAKFTVIVEGLPRNLHPILRDEIYRITREAVGNAFRHAHAREIGAEITYGERLLRLRIRDDGRGMDPGVVEAGRSGHFGLHGMRERAKRIGGELRVWSGAGAGTEIELNIPGRIAYGTRSRVFRNKAR
jgi:signal transduction histidine kinase/ligand-binding sensor domain-containing protein